MIDEFDTTANPDSVQLDSELMAFSDFSSRRRQAREVRESEQEFLESKGSSGAPELEILESMDEFTAAPRERKLESVIVEDVDLDKVNHVGSIPPNSTGAENPSEEESYAVKRVLELRMVARATPTLEPTDQTRKEAEEAHRINMDALEESKPKFGGGKKAAPAKSVTKLSPLIP